MDAEEINRLAAEMDWARESWQKASQEFIEAMAAFRDLKGTSDGRLRLRKAREAHQKALQEYTAAVNRYAEAVKQLDKFR